MDLALTINAWIDEEVIFAQQIGAKQVIARIDARTETAVPVDALANRVTQAGLTLAGLYCEGARANAETKDWLEGLLRAAGGAKIGLMALAPALLPADWPTLAEAAAQSGVKLAIPSQKIPGGLKTKLPGPCVGLDVTPGRLLDGLEHAAPGTEARVFLVSFEREAQDGGGFEDLLRVCWRLRQAGYTGLIRIGAPSHWKGDTREGHRALAYTTGFLRAALQTFK